MSFNHNLLEITIAPFQDAKSLERAVAKAFTKSTMNFDLDGFKLDQKNLMDSEISGQTIGEFIRTALQLIISEEIENKLLICCQRCLYNKEKIDQDFFEKEQNRILYYPIMVEVARKNLDPFIKSLLSQFGAIKKILKQEDPK